MPLNPLDENQVRAYRQDVLAALRDLSEHRVSFLVGVRRLAALAGEMRERERDFDLIVAIESESDHLPNESAKPYCSVEWLRECEEEERQLEAFYRSQVADLCEKLTKRFSGLAS